MDFKALEKITKKGEKRDIRLVRDGLNYTGKLGLLKTEQSGLIELL